MSDCFRIPAVVELAYVPYEGDEPPPMPASMGTPIADRARGTVARVGRAQWEVRDALSAVLEAVGGLEREVHRLRGLLGLAEQGIELRRELVHVGPDALVLQRSLGVGEGAQLVVYLALEHRDAQQLLCLRGVAEGQTIRLVEVPTDTRELLVAFTFQQEVRERRMARSG
jgi:hypothetical protein